MKSQLIKFINQLPYVNKLHGEVTKLRSALKAVKAELAESNAAIHSQTNLSAFPPGHYYSPIADLQYVKSRETQIWGTTLQELEYTIDFNVAGQLHLLKEFEEFYPELPFGKTHEPGLRFYFENEYYAYTDAIVLYSFIRYLKPKRIIEVGSGFSSSVMLDTRTLFHPDLNLTFIEPYPERLFSLISEEDRTKSEVIVKPVQDVRVRVFKQLEKNDILFIDSSHVVKTGSDLHYLLFNVIPNLNPGVHIHFHDVFYPFEYPKDWVYKGRNWNEDYFIRAFLMYNDQFQIQLFSHFLHVIHPGAFKNMPLCYNEWGGNLWLAKI